SIPRFGCMLPRWLADAAGTATPGGMGAMSLTFSHVTIAWMRKGSGRVFWRVSNSKEGTHMGMTQGFLDYGSGRYKLVGRAGMHDYYFHNGDWLEVGYRGQWLRVWVFSD